MSTPTSSEPKPASAEKKSGRPAMVGWFDPGQLLATGVRAVLADLFGGYADRREMQAALGEAAFYGFDPGRPTRWSTTNTQPQGPDDDERNAPPSRALPPQGLWIDFASDLGEGWNSTYAVASCLGKRQLGPEDFTSPLPSGVAGLPRADLLVLGGDLVYPTATVEQYEQRFVAPYADAFDGERPPGALRAGKPGTDQYPRLFAIPGNHDWYDGLGAFLKQLCQKRSIGGWFTMQERSYFAIQLPGGWWVWGTDIQLHADIDAPQQKYFHEICANYVKEGDKIILVTAEPVWVYDAYKNEPDGSPLKSNRNFIYFCEQYIFEHGLQLPLVLTGDLHHYASYYEAPGDLANPAFCRWKITAGGGGAFLHPTHQLPKVISETETQPRLVNSAVYPPPHISRRLMWGNLRFPWQNPRFCTMMGFLYLCFAWNLTGTVWYPNGGAAISESKNVLMQLSELAKKDVSTAWWRCFDVMGDVFFTSPLGLTVPILVFVGCVAFADKKIKNRKDAKRVAAIHGVFQVLAMIVIMPYYARFVFASQDNLVWYVSLLRDIAVYGAMFATGFLIGGLLMGIYLLVSLGVVDAHETEAFSSMRIQSYKNFLRMHLTPEKLTIYPIGVPEVPADWVENPSNRKADNPSENWWQPATGKPLKVELIEKPIVIRF